MFWLTQKKLSGSNFPFSGALRSKKMRERAHYFRFIRRERESRGLLGGARGIRTPGAARAYTGGIRPELGALFGPNTSIGAGENLFAWDSALFRLSRFPSFTRPMRVIVVMPNIRRRLRVQISASRAGGQQLNSFSSELHEGCSRRQWCGRGVRRGLGLSQMKLRSGVVRHTAMV